MEERVNAGADHGTWKNFTLFELQVLVEQIRSLNHSIAELEKVIDREGQKLKGHGNLTSIKGIGSLGASILLSVIGDVRDFPEEGKLAAYFGIVPAHPQLQRDRAFGTHYQARQQAGPHRPSPVLSDRQAVQPLPGQLLRSNPLPARNWPRHHRPGA